MNISNQTEKFGASTKRITTWRGMQVGFNKSKTKFFVIDELLTKDAAQYDSNGGRILTGRALELDEYEVGSLLN